MVNKEVKRKLRKNWWLVALKGLLAIVLGLLAIFQPIEVVVGLTLMIGVFLLAAGFFIISFTLSNRKTLDYWKWLAVQGGMDVLIGVLLVAMPQQSVLSVAYLLGAWLLIAGLVQIGLVWRFGNEFASRSMTLWNGLILLLLGLLIIFNPVRGIIGFSYLLGISLFIFGVAVIYLAFQLKGYVPRQIELQ